MTFNEIWEEFIAHKRKRIKPSSVANYMYIWEKLSDFFGEKEISSVTTKMVEKWVFDQLDSISRKTIQDRLVLLNNIIDYYGYEYEATVSRINMKYIKWPTRNIAREEKKLKVYTANDIRKILCKIAEDPQPCNVLIAVMIGTGIRIGEACALTYGDINLETKSIEINGTIERIRIKKICQEDFDRMNVKILHTSKSSAVVLSTPKCISSCRSIPVPGELLKVLKKFKDLYPADYYLSTNSHRLLEPRTLRTRYYRLLASAGIDRTFSPHSLRHTYATTMITSGVDVTTTAALLGHGDTSTTLSVYSHATSESKNKAIKNTIGKQFKIAMRIGR